MSRYFLLATVAFLALLTFRPFAESADDKPAKPDLFTQQLAKLGQPVRIQAELAGLPLQDVIAQLEKDHQLKFVVSEESFRREGVAAILEQKLNLKQKLLGVPVQQLLDLILPELNATMRLRNGYVEIFRVRTDTDDVLVSASFRDRPFQEVIQEIADEFGMTVVVAPQCENARMALVSARLRQVPFVTALELLAVQVELCVIKKPNSYLLTTVEHAERLHEREMRMIEQQNAKGVNQ
jgi:hypothetical protein